MKTISKSELRNQKEHDDQLIKYWTNWFMNSRLEVICRAFVSGEFAELYLKVAKKCGAIRSKFCADGSVQVTFKDMPKSCSTSI